MLKYIVRTTDDNEYFFTDEITDTMIDDNNSGMLDIISIEDLSEFYEGNWRKIQGYSDD